MPLLLTVRCGRGHESIMLAFTGRKVPQLAKPAITVLAVVLAVAAGVLGSIIVGALSS